MLLQPRKVIAPALGLTLVLQAGACKKDKDNQDDLLVGEWELVEVDGDKPDDEITFRFDADKDFRFCYDDGVDKYCYNGEWDWTDSDKDEVEMHWEDEFGDDYHANLKIDKLTKDVLEGEFESDGDSYDIVLKKI
jgi:hypothetical protein